MLKKRLAISTVLATSLLLVGCSDHPEGRVEALCDLADLPHNTAAELLAMRDDARRRLQAVGAFYGSDRNQRIFKAAMHVDSAAEGEASLAGLDPQSRQFFASARPTGFSLRERLAALQDACR